MSTVAETATLVHGFTMADVDTACRVASRIVPSKLVDMSDRMEVAWMAIVETLYSSAEAPTFYDLVGTGASAVRTEVNRFRADRGMGAFNERKPAHDKYWRSITDKQGFEDAVEERIALAQVLGALTPLQYDAVVTLAAYGDQRSAARALGITPEAFSGRMIAARKAINALWFAPETPPDRRMHQKNGFCAYGHDLAKDGWVANTGRLRCRICHRNQKRRAWASRGVGQATNRKR